MTDLRVFVKYCSMKNQLFGCSKYNEIPSNIELLEMLFVAAANVNRNMNSIFILCGAEEISVDKQITNDEMENFQVEIYDEEDPNTVIVELYLPGNEEKMNLVYEEFYKVFHMVINAKSYLLF